MVAELLVDERLNLDVCLSVDAVEISVSIEVQERQQGKEKLPASSFIHNQHFALVLSQQSPSNIEELLGPLTQMHIFHFSI